MEEAAIIALLTSRPTPEQVLAIQPSVELQNRASELLALSKEGELSPEEQRELDRYLTLEHLVRLAKILCLSNPTGFRELERLGTEVGRGWQSPQSAVEILSQMRR